MNSSSKKIAHNQVLSNDIGLKVCGMKFPHNMLEAAELEPDYMGFIFYEKSARFLEEEIPNIPKGIKKVGVFVNSEIDRIIELVNKHKLNAVQLHGNEQPDYCVELSKKLPEQIEIIKVFSIKSSFDFGTLKPFEGVCDYFLFDTKGDLPGGNGEMFDWSVLESYPSEKPFFLSGGIGLESINDLEKFLASVSAQYCKVIDVNSRFESEPGLKKINELKTFKKLIQQEKEKHNEL